jgi:hypothetical protein
MLQKYEKLSKKTNNLLFFCRKGVIFSNRLEKTWRIAHFAGYF